MSTTYPNQNKRWRQARDRAIKENVNVYQVESTGQWVATSGTQSGVAYALTVRGNIAISCTCKAGAPGGVCKHRAIFFELLGAFADSFAMLEAEEFARDAAATIAPRPCSWCSGRGQSFNEYHLENRKCSWCEGTGSGLPVVA